jgi:antitoxin ParD1/3/4
MATMNVNLPDEMRVCVDALVKSGEFQSNSDYVRDIIRADLERRAAWVRLTDDVQAGFDGQGVAFSPKMWQSFSKRVLAAIEKPRA